MQLSKWMLAIGYGCLAITGACLLGRPRSPAAQPLEPITRVLAQDVGGGSAPTVVLLLNPQDCADRIEMLTAWNPLHQSGRVRVLGLVSDVSPDPHPLENIRSGVGTRFPLQSIDHDRMVSTLRGLNYASTPVALVLDSSGRLRMAVPLFEQNAAELVDAAMLQLQTLESPASTR
jgi:hypothetical protein